MTAKKSGQFWVRTPEAVGGACQGNFERPYGPISTACARQMAQKLSDRKKCPMSGGLDSYDLDGKIESYLWDFGDGVHGSGATTSHEFSIGGNYRVTLEIQDNNGAKHTKTTILAIKGVAPLFEETTVFQGGTEGYYTFRIPAIIRAPNDDLLAFAEGWINNRGGSRENKDIVMKRSTNHGQSWSPLQVIVNHKDNFPQYYGYQVAPGNVAPVVDRNTGTIWLPFSRDINKKCSIHSLNMIGTLYILFVVK